MAKPHTKHLRLKAENTEDLKVISGAVQDAILRVEGIVYDAKRHSLMLGLQRLRREDKGKTRILSGLRFDSVLSLKSSGIDRTKENAFLVLLSTSFEAGDAPAGRLLLEFAGGGRLLAELECLDVTLLDRGDSWAAKSIPEHEL